MDARIREMKPDQRLDAILAEGEFRPAVTYSGGLPAVCFTESSVAGVEYLIRDCGFPPWGIVFDRQWVFEQGGAPVWYYRSEVREELFQLSDRVRTWGVRLDGSDEMKSDWLHEREWRIPVETGTLKIDPDAVVATIIGAPDWKPSPIDVVTVGSGHYVDMLSGEPSTDLSNPYVQEWLGEAPVYPACWEGKEHWTWVDGELCVVP
ncbi:hypothetical protein [Actinophytocola xinjiangensis]|uniref:hypothetical protein n=1 Tax=Actinophytocola xinjiangensis TaxID=485602 RepID=UPI0012BA1861|nr:hypothetical protein [Actinophytocola xinjiangensis]